MFFFKQKTAYEMRISDWSSDVCSSDLITGVHRTWLSPEGDGKAPIDTPRRAMGDLLGHAVRFGTAHDVIAAGEGIETILSLRMALPGLPMAAALSAAHLSAILFPATDRKSTRLNSSH